MTTQTDSDIQFGSKQGAEKEQCNWRKESFKR